MQKTPSQAGSSTAVTSRGRRRNGTTGRARGRRQIRGRGGRGGGPRSQNVQVPPPINRANRAHEDRIARETEFMVHNLL